MSLETKMTLVLILLTLRLETKTTLEYKDDISLHFSYMGLEIKGTLL